MKRLIESLTAIAPFIAPYPLWVKALVVAWVVLSAILVLSLILARPLQATKESALEKNAHGPSPSSSPSVGVGTGDVAIESISGDKVGGDKIGRDKVPISGDYVAGDKTVNIIISDSALEAKVQRAAEVQRKELASKYPQGSVLFGITQKGLIVPKGLVPTKSEIQWDTAQVLKLTEKSITILVPRMTINTETNKGIQIIGQVVELPKKVGAKRVLLGLPYLLIQVEVLGIDPEMVIVGIGFIPK